MSKDTDTRAHARSHWTEGKRAETEAAGVHKGFASLRQVWFCLAIFLHMLCPFFFLFFDSRLLFSRVFIFLLLCPYRVFLHLEFWPIDSYCSLAHSRCCGCFIVPSVCLGSWSSVGMAQPGATVHPSTDVFHLLSCRSTASLHLFVSVPSAGSFHIRQVMEMCDLPLTQSRPSSVRTQGSLGFWRSRGLTPSLQLPIPLLAVC